MTEPTVNQIKALARTALKDSDPNHRTEAILALRHYDHPQILTLLERIIANDDHPGVRDIAKNVLTKKRIAAGIPTDLPIAGDSGSAARAPAPSSTWQCQTCGGDNERDDKTCQYCGAPRTSTRTRTAPDTRRPRIDEQGEINRILKEKVFLVDKKNQEFLQGKRRKPAGISSGGGCGMVGMMLFISMFCAVGIGLIVGAISAYNNYRDLSNRGVVTNGQYYERYIDRDSEDGDTYYVRFAFVTNDGRQINKQQSVSRSEYDRIEPGMRMEVMYDPQNPGNAVINGTNSSGGYVFLTLFGIFWNLISWTIMLAIVFGWRRQAALVKRGKVIPGRVIASSGYYDSDNDYNIEIRYSAELPTGGTVEKKYDRLRNDLDEKGLPPIGTPLAVLYLNTRNMDLL